MNCTLTQTFLSAPLRAAEKSAGGWFWGCVLLSITLHLLVVLVVTGWVGRPPLIEKPEPPGLSLELEINADPSPDPAASAPRETASLTPETEISDRPREQTTPSKVASETNPAPKRPSQPQRAAGNMGSAARGEATPSPLGNPRPEYPVFAKRKGWQGECLLRVVVTPEGRADGVSIHRSSGYAILDQSAVAAVRRWRFLPRVVAGQRLASTIEVPVNFSLLDG